MRWASRHQKENKMWWSAGARIISHRLCMASMKHFSWGFIRMWAASPCRNTGSRDDSLLTHKAGKFCRPFYFAVHKWAQGVQLWMLNSIKYFLNTDLMGFHDWFAICFSRRMKTILIWCILLVLCWPLALIMLVLFPFLWLLSIPFRIVSIILEALIKFLKALFLLPFRLIRAI